MHCKRPIVSLVINLCTLLRPHLLPVQVQIAPANAASAVNKINNPLAPSYLLHSRYSIVGQIGTGGFGAVYQAKYTLFSNRPVAIKEMSQDGLSPREQEIWVPV